MNLTTTQRYVDQAAYDEYTANDGPEIVKSILLDAPVGVAFDSLLKYCWVANMKELAPGVGRGLVGHTRQLPMGVGIEQIVSVGLPSENSKVDEIASICYKLRVEDSTITKDHIGLIRFVSDASSSTPKTLVVWSIKITTTGVGSAFLCGGSLLRAMLKTVVGNLLKDLEAKVKADAKSASV